LQLEYITSTARHQTNVPLVGAKYLLCWFAETQHFGHYEVT